MGQQAEYPEEILKLKKRLYCATYHYWPPDFGGELLLSIERFKGLARRGFQITVLTSGRPAFPSRYEDEGLLILRSPQVGSTRLASVVRRLVYFFWACWRLKRDSFDFYHEGSSPGVDWPSAAICTWAFTRLARLKKAKTVTVYSLPDGDGSGFGAGAWASFWRRASFHCFNAIVAVSPGLYRVLRASLPRSAKLIVYGVRDDLFAELPDPERRDFRSSCGLAEDQVVFTFLGAVGRRKGFDLLAEAFCRLAVRHPSWQLWVIGPHTHNESRNLEEEEVSYCTRPLRGLEKQVTYWGRIDERRQLNRILASSDVFVLPSRREGMGLAPVEAMSAGLPVILSRIPGVTDLANVEGETGLYVPVGDADALQAAMEQLGENATLRRVMGASAARRARKSFGWENHLDQWQALYEDVAGR